MVYQTTFNVGGYGDAYFETVNDASDIIAAFKAGKNVIFYFPVTGGIFETGETGSRDYGWKTDAYMQMTYYQSAGAVDHNRNPEGCIVCDWFLPFGSYQLQSLSFMETRIADNGKLRFQLYVD